MAGPVMGFFSVNHCSHLCDNNALSYPSKKDTTCNFLQFIFFFFFLNQNCGDICCFPVLHIWLWLKEHLRRKQQLFLGYGFNESKGDALMARIKAIFGRVNTQAKSVQFCVWGNDSQSKGNYRRGKRREKKTTQLVGRFNGPHTSTFEPNSWFRCNASMLSYDS